jgi:hypothetical protein
VSGSATRKTLQEPRDPCGVFAGATLRPPGLPKGCPLRLGRLASTRAVRPGRHYTEKAAAEVGAINDNYHMTFHQRVAAREYRARATACDGVKPGGFAYRTSTRGAQHRKKKVR